MIGNLFGWLVLVLVTIGFGWLVARAWRARRWFVKWPGVVLGGVFTLAFGLVSLLALIGITKLYATGGHPPETLTVARTAEQVERGEHLADVFCVSCHSTNGQLPLSGGMDLANDIPIPLGSMVAGNLTPAGPLKDWTDGEILRALREGYDRHGNKLFVMSNVFVRNMSDDDVHAVIAFLRSQPAVENKLQAPLDQPNLLAAVMTGAGMLPTGLPPVSGHITAPPRGQTVEYGAYLISFQDCKGCHGEDLNGGTNSLTPNGPSLRAVKGWTQDQFVTTIRTGVNPGGHAMQPPMPWKDLAKMEDDELGALYKYIVSVQ